MGQYEQVERLADDGILRFACFSMLEVVFYDFPGVFLAKRLGLSLKLKQGHLS